MSKRAPCGSNEVLPAMTGARMVSARVRRALSRRGSLSRKGAGDSGQTMTPGATGCSRWTDRE